MDSYIINGVCRCCASQGSSKDIDSAYTWMGDEEIYSKMLRDCFDIALERSEAGHDGGICELCVTQLRNAFNFKKQVVNTEEMLKKRIHSDPFKTDVKLEVSREDPSDSDNDAADHDMGDDSSVKDFLVPIKMEVEVDAVTPTKAKRAAKAGTSSAKKPKLEAETSKNQRWKEDLTCQLCDRAFAKLFNLKRHMQLSHRQAIDVTRKALCEACGKVVHNKEWLAKHLAKGCPGRSTTACLKCNATFATKHDMAQHMNTKHWNEHKLTKLRCPMCEIACHDHETLEEHLFSEHQIVMEYKEKSFDCLEDLTQWKRNIEIKDGVHFLRRPSQNGDTFYHCYPISQLTNDRKLSMHQTCPARIQVKEDDGAYTVTYQSKHICSRNKGSKLFCPVCSIGCERSDEIYKHLAAVHDVELKDQKLTFDSYDAFLAWKADVEKTGQFYKRTSSMTPKKGGQMTKSYYFCAKLGRCRRTKKLTTERKTCPAKIILSMEDNNSSIYQVLYQSKHLGHDPKKDKGKLTKDERSKLAERIRNGECLTDIINKENQRDGSNKTLRKMDLYNIIRDFKIAKRLVNGYTRHNKLKTETHDLSEIIFDPPGID